MTWVSECVSEAAARINFHHLPHYNFLTIAGDQFRIFLASILFAYASTSVRFQSLLIPFKFTFHRAFPWRKQSLGKKIINSEFFFIQWMLKINIPTSPLPLWEHAVRSKRDILFLKPKSSSNSIMSELRFSSLRKFRLWIFFKKLIYLELPM